MRYKYAFYCSGSASRLLAFYTINKLKDYPFEFVYYDGFNINSIENLKKLFNSNQILLPDKNVFDVKRGKLLSEFISCELLEHMQRHKIDYLFCFGDKILKPNLVGKYRNKIVNFHPSILPSFPGLNAIDQALNSSVQLIGNTAHFVDETIDTGPIIIQTAIPRASYVDYNSVLDLQIPMLEKIWSLLESDLISVDAGKVHIEISPSKNVIFSL